MIYYLLFFFDCFLIEYYRKHNKRIALFFIVALYFFLCFGYMTGSDWREYEMYYTGLAESSHATKGDLGYVWLSGFFVKFIPDFWLFTAIFKIFYLVVFTKFIQLFQNNAYYVIGFAFTGSVLFMLIDCPLRFMIAMSFALLGIILWFKEKRILSLIPLLIAPTMHMAIFFVILIFATFPISKLFSKTNRVLIFGVYILMLYVAFKTPVFTYIFENIIPFFGTERYESYEEAETAKLVSLGTLKYTLLLLILLSFRDIIVNKEKGHIVYYFAVLSILFQPLLMCIPTAFRINILSDSFMWIALASIYADVNKSSFVQAFRVFIIVFCLVFISRDCITNWRYTPYSNSFTHIITGNHPSYSIRSSYNPIHHDDEFWH